MTKKPNMEIDKLSEDEIVIKGKRLSLRWLDSYLLIYSKEEHKYEEYDQEAEANKVT